MLLCRVELRLLALLLFLVYYLQAHLTLLYLLECLLGYLVFNGLLLALRRIAWRRILRRNTRHLVYCLVHIIEVGGGRGARWRRTRATAQGLVMRRRWTSVGGAHCTHLALRKLVMSYVRRSTRRNLRLQKALIMQRYGWDLDRAT